MGLAEDDRGPLRGRLTAADLFDSLGRLTLRHVNRDIPEVDRVWAEYLGDHPVNRRAYGLDLQRGMLVEADCVAEVPDQ